MLKAQDIVLALFLTDRPPETQSELATALGLSQAEISNSLKRLQESRLVLGDRKVVLPHLEELCLHGIKYFYPARLGRKAGGVPTVGLAPPLRGELLGEETEVVWPSPRGTARATTLEPIHPSAVNAAASSERTYQLLALLDAIRIGGVRAREIASEKFHALLRATP